MRRRVQAALASVLLLGVTGVVAVVLAVVRPTVFRGHQVRTFADMQVLRQSIERYKGEHFSYPTALDELSWGLNQPLPDRDGWGAPFHYQSDGGYYVLASYGRANQPDFADYRQVRDTEPTCNEDWQAWDVRGIWDADQIVSDRGRHRQAGK